MEAFQELIRTENIINEQIKGIVVYIRTAGNEFWGVEDVPISFLAYPPCSSTLQYILTRLL
jgi:hypothetical protein